MSPDREKEIRQALEVPGRGTITLKEDIRDLLAALDEARAERDRLLAKWANARGPFTQSDQICVCNAAQIRCLACYHDAWVDGLREGDEESAGIIKELKSERDRLKARGEADYEAGAFDSLLSEEKRTFQRPLRWTTEPPTSPGWYWLRFPGEVAGIVRVTDRDGALRVEHGAHVANFEGEWAGPTPAPEISAPERAGTEGG